MRLRCAALLFVTACSFEHGALPAAQDGGDGGSTADADAAELPPDATRIVTRKLLLDNSASTVDFLAHPVLVVLDSTKIDYSMIADPTKDLRFEYAKDGAAANIGDNVPFEIEKWDPTGDSIVWIRVPEMLLGTTDTAVLMHYGPDAGGQADAAATWASWELVNHMAPSVASSAGAYGGTAINTTVQPGQMGDSIGFNTGNSGVTFANGGMLFSGWDAFTMIFWLYVDYNNVGEVTGEPRVMDKGTSLSLGRIYSTMGEIRFQVDLHFTGGSTINAIVTNVPPKTWTMATITFDGDYVYVARNGGAYGMGNVSGTDASLLTSTNPFFLGSGTTSFKGRIDELRIEKRFRSNDYARAQYASMTRQMVTFHDP